MNKILRVIALTVTLMALVFTLGFLAIGFVMWDFNPFNWVWDQDGRLLVLTCGLILIVPCAGVSEALLLCK